MSRKVRVCEWCGELFQPNTSDLNRGYGRTCSRTCGAHLREALKRGEGGAFPSERESKGHDPDDEIDYQEDY